MKIASWNVNGLRAIAKRDFSKWLQNSQIDVMCIQEIKIDALSLTPNLTDIPGYYSTFSHAVRKGYAGVGIYSKIKPHKIIENVVGDKQCKQEGRTLLVEFDELAILTVYMPHGGRDKSKLTHKMNAYKALMNFLKNYRGKPLVLAGDFNIAHQDIDLARPKQNRHNIMFTTEERQCIDALLEKEFKDSYRYLHPDDVAYTWWPYIATARERNIGWRIDYIFVQHSLAHHITEAAILTDVSGSDHCPQVILIGF